MRPDRARRAPRYVGVAAAAVLLGGCAVGGSNDDGHAERGLAARPSSLPPEPTDTVAPSASGSPSPATSGAPSGGASAGPGRRSTTGPGAGSASRQTGSSPTAGTQGGAATPPFHTIGSTSDASGDAGPATPGYADVVSVTIEDNGPNARLTISMRSPVPATLPADETMGVGVDLYRSPGQIESDYQVFADGEPSGWYAYLTGPHGRVRYQGAFGIGGTRLVFTVPWSALGSPQAGRFSAFADWTKAASPANLSGEDHAPALGTASYAR